MARNRAGIERYTRLHRIVHLEKEVGANEEEERDAVRRAVLLPRLRVDPWGRAVAGRRVFAVFSLVTRAARRSAAEITA